MREGEICSILRHVAQFVAESVVGYAQLCNVKVRILGRKCRAAWQERTGGGWARSTLTLTLSQSWERGPSGSGRVSNPPLPRTRIARMCEHFNRVGEIEGLGRIDGKKLRRWVAWA